MWWEGGRGGGLLKGGKKEGDHKHSANDLKHTNNTGEINGTAQMKTFTPGANVAECFLCLDREKTGREKFGREETASSSCIHKT